MNNTRKILVAAAAFAAMTAPMVSVAGPTVYTDKATFLAAISGAATDSFDDLTTVGLQASTLLSRTAGVYTYDVTTTAGNGLFSVPPTGTDRWISSAAATASLLFNNFAGGVYGVGGYFFSTDTDGNYFSGEVTVTGADGTTSTQSIPSASTTSFLGFYSSLGILSVSILSSQVGAPNGGLYATANDLVLGGRTTTGGGNVPEPGSLALMALAVAALAATTRRARVS